MSNGAAAADWTEPGVYPVAPGVHRIPLPLAGDALKAVNVYAVADGTGLALIDAGWALAGNEDLLEAALGTLGAGLGDITAFHITHAHVDHYTLATAIRRRCGTRVRIGIGEQPTLQALDPAGPGPRDPSHTARLDRCGAHELAAVLRRAGSSIDLTHWTAPDDWLTHGQDLGVHGRALTALHTPGHTRGHLVFHDPQHALLFSGDHVLPHITPSIGFEVAPVPLPLADFLTSLALLRDLPDARLLPAHGPPTDSVHSRVEELLQHHEQRLQECLDAVQAGAHTAFQVAGRLTWTRRRRSLTELDVVNSLLAVLETGAHLDVLAVRGLLMRSDQDGVDHFVER